MLGPLRGALGPLGVSLGAAAGNGLLTGLVAYWALDEAGGANDALDKHGGLTLTQVSSPGSAAGKVYAGARTFDGAADYFTRASEAALQTGDVDWAIAAWIYPTADGDDSIFGKEADSAAGNREYRLVRDADRTCSLLGFQASGGLAFVAGSTDVAATNSWSLVIGYYSAASRRASISINYGAEISAARSAAPATSSAPCTIGSARASSGPLLFTGRIGPVAFWKNRTLDAAARAALWNGGAGLAYSAFTA